ncbi:MAG: pyrroloquinoline quinone-dependent dehydrogenase [Myxococcota bacterium]
MLRTLQVALELAAVGLLALACGEGVTSPRSGPIAEWPVYGGDPGGQQWSPLTEIGPENVSALEPAWTFHTGDVSAGDEDGRNKTAFQATPIVVEDRLFFCSPLNRVFALDPATGEALWTYDPEVAPTGHWLRTCRGVAFVRTAAEGACAARVFTGTMDARLIALDAQTGLPCADFGVNGNIDLRAGVGVEASDEYAVTSPPTVIGDVVVVGSQVSDGQRVDAPSGVVRGFDVHNGALRWAFDPAAPGTPPKPAAPDGTLQYHAGTPNAWSILAADPARGLVFLPTGNPSPDFFGGARAGSDHFGSAVVALDAATGAVRWHFQTVHHDLWDYDVAAQPTLLDFTTEAGVVPALLQATKMGHLFLLDRTSGVPVFPVEERPVPASTLPDEQAAPTQPFPTHLEGLLPEHLGPEQAWGLFPWERNACAAQIDALDHGGLFVPPSLRGTLQSPGVAGGVNWGGVAVDPETGVAVLNVNRMPNVERVVPRDEADAVVVERPRSTLFPQRGTPYAHFQSVLVSDLGVPCTAPPWGTLLALELETGEVRWEVPFGSTRGLAPFPFWFEWGLPSMGGPIVTASGLVFIGAAMDDALRAYDLDTGDLLWKATLPAGGQATPLTYRLAGGRQFVVIAAGGHGTLGTTLGDSLVAFALPEAGEATRTPPGLEASRPAGARTRPAGVQKP